MLIEVFQFNLNDISAKYSVMYFKRCFHSNVLSKLNFKLESFIIEMGFAKSISMIKFYIKTYILKLFSSSLEYV